MGIQKSAYESELECVTAMRLFDALELYRYTGDIALLFIGDADPDEEYTFKPAGSEPHSLFPATYVLPLMVTDMALTYPIHEKVRCAPFPLPLDSICHTGSFTASSSGSISPSWTRLVICASTTYKRPSDI